MGVSTAQKRVIALILAIIVGTALYTIMPPDWPEGTYQLTIEIPKYGVNGTLTYVLGNGSQDTTATFTDGSVNITASVGAVTSISPGSKIVITAKIEGVENLTLSDIHLKVVTPDGRHYEYLPIKYSNNEAVFEIQPYSKLKESAFIFGSAIVLFAAASVIHYVITGIYVTLALVIAGVVAQKTAFTLYMAPLIWVFIAGSAMELIIKETGLDKRVARTLTSFATSPARLIIGAGLIVSFLSMWMSNTAATYVVLPLVISLVTQAKIDDTRFSSILFASLAMAASVGGTATIIGTPPNLIVSQLLNDVVYKNVGATQFMDFNRWLIVGAPAWLIGVTIGLLLAIIYARVVAGNELPRIGEALKKLKVEEEKKPLSKPEILGLANMLFLVTLWLTEPIHHISSGIAGAIGLLVFFATGVLNVKKHFKKLAWDLMVLFGAGLTLGKALMATGFAEQLLVVLSPVRYMGFAAWFVVGFAAYVVGTFISSHTSASAFIAPLTIPLGMLIAAGMGIPLEAGAAVATIAAVVSLNNAVALPISTPPSAIVYSTGRVKMRDLVTYGLLYGIIANTLTIGILANYWIRVLTP